MTNSLQRAHLPPRPVGYSNEVPYNREWHGVWNNIYEKEKKPER